MLDYDLTDALEMPRHGSAEDRGSADAYYGRQPEPHYYEGATMQLTKKNRPNRGGKQSLLEGLQGTS